MPETQALSLPSLLDPRLLELVRKRFALDHELRRRFRGLARSIIADAQDTTRPPEIVLQQMEMGIIRRAAVRAELEPDDLQWLIDHGFVRPGMHDTAGATILVRLPELLASEMAHAIADELVKRSKKDLHETAAWIAGAASNLPLGEVVAAQAIVDAAKRPNGLPVGLISALVEMPPEREVLDAGGHYAMVLPNGAMMDIKIRPDGKGIVIIDGEQHEIDLSDEEQVTYKNIHPWLILSHVASTPFEVVGRGGIPLLDVVIGHGATSLCTGSVATGSRREVSASSAQQHVETRQTTASRPIDSEALRGSSECDKAAAHQWCGARYSLQP